MYNSNFSDIKHLLLSRGIVGLSHLEQVWNKPEQAEDLLIQAEQLILAGDITVGGLDSLLRLLDGISQGISNIQYPNWIIRIIIIHVLVDTID